MWKMEIGFIVAIMILGVSFTNGYAEVYIVTMEDEPVVSYKGGVNGFEATAVESDEKIDVTSLSTKKSLMCNRGSYCRWYRYFVNLCPRCKMHSVDSPVHESKSLEQQSFLKDVMNFLDNSENEDIECKQLFNKHMLSNSWM